MLKSSRFNFWASAGQNCHLLYNGVTGALYEMNDQERSITTRLLGAPNERLISDEALHHSLSVGGFLVAKDIDEVEELVERNRRECSRHPTLDLTLSPTYQCNFRCKYCYVNFEGGRMQPDVEERVVKFIDHELPGFQQLNITWFGGEPLLCFDTIVRVSRRIREVALRYGVGLRIFVTTNGYLLKRGTARTLSEAGARFFHVTVDGSQRYHDHLRVLANGGPTYVNVMDNLLNLLSDVVDAHVTLRMNTNEDNIGSLYEVLEGIPADFRKRIQVNVTPILTGESTPSPRLYRLINSAVRNALESGYLYYDIHIPVRRRTFCTADRRRNFQIGPDGTLYKCSPSDKPEVQVGYLNAQGLPDLNQNYDVWHRVAPVGDRCLDCPYLCFCGGGCRLKRLRQNMGRSCQLRYADLNALIVNRYLAILHDSLEAEI